MGAELGRDVLHDRRGVLRLLVRVAVVAAVCVAAIVSRGEAQPRPARDSTRRDTTQRDTTQRDTTQRDTTQRLAVADSAPPPVQGSVGPLFIPAIFYAPETGLGGGAGVLYLRTVDSINPAQRPSTHAANAIVTARGQYALALLNDIWTRGNGWRLGLDVSWSRFPNRFYGVGALRADSGETFTPTTSSVLLSAQRQFWPGIYAGPKFVHEDAAISDIVPGGILAGGATGASGWRLATLSWLTTWDRRDRVYWPTQGHLISAAIGRAFGHLGSTHTFNRLTIDARTYRRLSGEHLLAAQLWADFTDGAVPFDRLPQLGGPQLLRGYFAGRFRDRHSATVQMEYRTPGMDWSWENRLSFVLFLATGGTARDPTAFAIDQLHSAGGAGVRFALTPSDRLNFRLDYGVGRGSNGFYITLGEAF